MPDLHVIDQQITNLAARADPIAGYRGLLDVSST
jgi:hypothetical protein